MKALEPVVANFEFVKNEKIKEYGKEDDNGQVSINPEEEPETFKKYQTEIEELLSTFVKVDTIKAEDVIDKDIPADALVAIYDLIGE